MTSDKSDTKILSLLERENKYFLSDNRMTSYSCGLGGGSINYWNGKHNLDEFAWLAPLEGKEAVLQVFDKNKTKDMQQLIKHSWRPDRIAAYYRSHEEAIIEERKTVCNDTFVDQIGFTYESSGLPGDDLELFLRLSGVTHGKAELKFENNYLHIHELDGCHAGIHKIIGFDRPVECVINDMQYQLELPLKLPPLSADAKHLEAKKVVLVVAMGEDLDETLARYWRAMKNPDVLFEENTLNWTDYFEKNVPHFDCDDSQLVQLYYYNYYVSKSNTYDFGKGYFKYPFSAPSKLRLMPMWYWDIAFHAIYEKWLNDCPVSRGSILDYLGSQAEDGFIPMTLSIDSHIFEGDIQPLIIPIAIWDIYLCNGEKDFLEQTLDHLIAFDKWLEQNRSNDGGDTVFLKDPGESGWDNSKRYIPSGAMLMSNSDVAEDKRKIESPDFNTYYYLARTIIARMARELQRGTTAEQFEAKAQKTLQAIRAMWNDTINLYSDRYTDTGELTTVKTPGGMIPMLADAPDKNQTGRMIEQLTDPGVFWSEYPVVSLSIDDPDFNIEDEYQGYWNGRVWPNVNWLVVEGLKRKGALELAQKISVQSLKMEVASGLPLCRESYHPFTGECFVRYDVENYGWGGITNDMLIRNLIGLQPNIPRDEIYLNPMLPEGLNWVQFENVRLGGHIIDFGIRKHNEGYELTISHKGPKKLLVKASTEAFHIRNTAEIKKQILAWQPPHWLSF